MLTGCLLIQSCGRSGRSHSPFNLTESTTSNGGAFTFLVGEGKSSGIAIAPHTSSNRSAELLLLSLFLAPPSTEAGGHRFMQVLLRFYDQFVQDKFISHKTMHKILPKWSLILFQSI